MILIIISILVIAYAVDFMYNNYVVANFCIRMITIFNYLYENSKAYNPPLFCHIYVHKTCAVYILCYTDKYIIE